MQYKMTRRAMVKGASLRGASSGLGSDRTLRRMRSHRSIRTIASQALGFHHGCEQVNAATNATYKAGAKCSTARSTTGKAGDASGGCNILRA